MASQSAHFNLTKPASTDYYSLTVVNDNTDIIDTQMYNNQVSAAKVMVGATSSADGESGRVPAPTSADRTKYLKGDGTWDTPSGGGGSSTLDGLTDVSISSPTNGQALVYDATNQEWVNGTVSGGGSGGVTATVLSNTLWSSTGTYTLNDDYDNYDMLEIYFCNPSAASGESDLITVMVDDVKNLMDNSKILNLTGYGERYVNCTFSADEFTITASSSGGVQRIVGYKFNGGGDITDLDFSDMTGPQTMDVMNKLNSGVSDSDSGTFTTGGTQYAKVEVNCGFRPTYIQVILPFSNGDTTAVYDASISTTTSTWTIPQEHNTYTIQLGSETGETGITDITDTGFKFRCNAVNTRNVQCTYSASVGGETYIQTVDFDDISATQGTDILGKLDFTNLTVTQIADLKTALGIS